MPVRQPSGKNVSLHCSWADTDTPTAVFPTERDSTAVWTCLYFIHCYVGERVVTVVGSMIEYCGQFKRANRPSPEIIVFNDPSKRKKVLYLSRQWCLLRTGVKLIDWKLPRTKCIEYGKAPGP